MQGSRRYVIMYCAEVLKREGKERKHAPAALLVQIFFNFFVLFCLFDFV
jgi:hypothetical protein